MRVLKTLSILALALTIAAPVAHAALKLPRVSPTATVSQALGMTDLSVSFSRPGVKGRTIWGELVPYDQPWRTGANEATTFTTSTDLVVEGQKLPAGTYTFLTVPGKDEWTIVFSKQKDLWGAYEYKPEEDALRVKVKPQAAEHTEWMTIGFENLAATPPTPGTGELVVRWEKLRVPVRLEVDAMAQALEHARAEVAAAKPDDWRTPNSAAGWFFNAGANLDLAAQWVDKSIAVQKTYQNLSLKARMKQKAGDTKAAVALAKEAVDVGKASKDKVDTSATEKLIGEWTAQK